jgi:hypothetical protein
MAHDHHHDSANAYRAEQLFGVALCGALGGVMALMYFNGMVRYLFGPNEAHYQRVLLGAAGLLVVVLLRAIYVWFSIEPKHLAHHHSAAGCEPGHYHLHFYQHREATKPAPALTCLPLAADLPASVAHKPDRGCPHGHDTGWAPTRFLLLGLPVFLFLLGWPLQGISGGSDVKLSAEELSQVVGADRGGKADGVQEVTFRQLALAARDRSDREELTGQMIRVTGMYVGEDPARFALVRYKVTCCAADALASYVVVRINPSDQEEFQLEPARYQNKWVTVTGRLQFVYRFVSNEYMPVLTLFPDEKTPLDQLVKIVPAPVYPYVD